MWEGIIQTHGKERLGKLGDSFGVTLIGMGERKEHTQKKKLIIVSAVIRKNPR